MNGAVQLSPASEVEYLSVFQKPAELKSSFLSSLSEEMNDRGLVVLDSNAVYSLVVTAVTLYETEETISSSSCYFFSKSFEIQKIKLSITVRLYDNNNSMIKEWTEKYSEEETVISKKVTENDEGNETCEGPRVEEMENFRETKMLEKVMKSICKKVTNKIVSLEK